MTRPETTIGDDASDEPWIEWEYDDDPRDWDEEDSDDFDCHLGTDGQCGAAGSEMCDFECPNRHSELFCGSCAWCKKHGVKYRG